MQLTGKRLNINFNSINLEFFVQFARSVGLETAEETSLEGVQLGSALGSVMSIEVGVAVHFFLLRLLLVLRLTLITTCQYTVSTLNTEQLYSFINTGNYMNGAVLC
jgi:hypothetical protein